jgi:hypothetical protein
MSYFAVILLLYPFGPFLASFLGCRPFFSKESHNEVLTAYWLLG